MITVHISPPDGGSIGLDGRRYDRRIGYEPGGGWRQWCFHKRSTSSPAGPEMCHQVESDAHSPSAAKLGTAQGKAAGTDPAEP